MKWRARVESPVTCRVTPARAVLLHLPLCMACIGAIVVSTGCRRDADAANKNGVDAPAPKPPELLVFPQSIHVEDPRVNAFVERAMEVCASGDYDAFRILWSAREEPLPRKEYEKGWQAVQEIRIHGLERVLLDTNEKGGEASTGQMVYALFAEVSMDPDHPAAAGEPIREVALMLVYEHEKWRLSKTPRAMRTWLKERFKKQDGDSEPSGAAGGS